MRAARFEGGGAITTSSSSSAALSLASDSITGLAEPLRPRQVEMAYGGNNLVFLGRCQKAGVGGRTEWSEMKTRDRL
jgi:hypothetical protein